MSHLKTMTFELKFSVLTVLFLLRGFIMWNLVQRTWPLHCPLFLIPVFVQFSILNGTSCWNLLFSVCETY